MLNWISTLKYYAIALFGFLVVLFWGLLQSKKKEFAQAKLKGIKQARETEKKTNKAIVEGLQREKHNKDKRNYDDDGFV